MKLNIQKFLSLVTLLIMSMPGCESDDNGDVIKPTEEVCDQYYLKTQVFVNAPSETKLIYNDIGKVSKWIHGKDGEEPFEYSFSYDVRGRLSEVFQPGGHLHYKVHYDSQERPQYALRYLEPNYETLSDSTVFEYDADNRMIKQSRYDRYRQFSLARYSNFQFTGENGTSQDLFVANAESGELEHVATRKYSYDDKKRPMPSDMDVFFERKAENPPCVNNVITFEYIDIKSGTSSSSNSNYEYNEAGYPVKYFTGIKNMLSDTFEYSCEPVKE